MRTWLPFLLLCTPLIMGAAWILTLPPGHGPDEEAHLTYVKELAKEHRLPQLDFEPGGIMWEGHQPPLYYAVAAIISPLTGIDWDLRWLSLILGMGSVMAYYGLALRLFPGHTLEAAFLAGTTGLLPMFSFLSATINNGAMVQLAVAIVLYAGVDPEQWKGRHSWLLGVAVSAAILSKLPGLFLLPFLALVWLRHYLDGKLTIPEVIQISGRLLLVVTVLTGWWFWRNWLLYGDPFGWDQQMAAAVSLVRRARLTPDYLYAVIVELWRSFWAAFGPAARQTASPSVYIFLSLAVAPGVAGLTAARWRTRSSRWIGAALGGVVVAFLGWPLAVPWFVSPSPLIGGIAAKALLTILIGAALLLVVRSIRWFVPSNVQREASFLGLAFLLLLLGVFRYNIDFPQPQGRFLMPCVVSVIYLLELGWIAILGWHRRWIPLAAGMILAGLANILSLIHYAV